MNVSLNERFNYFYSLKLNFLLTLGDIIRACNSTLERYGFFKSLLEYPKPGVRVSNVDCYK